MGLVINILNRAWTVELFTQQELDAMNIYDTLGLCLFPKREILLLDSMVGEEMRYIVIHELVHALLYEFGVSQMEQYNAEFVCDFIAGNYMLIHNLTQEIMEEIENGEDYH